MSKPEEDSVVVKQHKMKCAKIMNYVKVTKEAGTAVI